MMNKRKNTSVSVSVNPFTLVELLVVCAIIAFLAGISVAGIAFAMRRATDTKCKSMMRQIELALNEYKAKTGYYPQQYYGCNFMIDKPLKNQTDLTDFLPTYQKWCESGLVLTPEEYSPLLDSFGTPFWYRCPGYHNKGAFDLESAGQDTYFGYRNDDRVARDQAYGPKWIANATHADKYRNSYYPTWRDDNISNWSND